MNPAFYDAFNLLCGDKIASGSSRDVFQCRLRPELVVKVEIDSQWRNFANVKEMQFWCDNQYVKSVSKWLAPCEYLSPDGRILLQQKATVAIRAELPEQLPAFLTDIKLENFGIINRQLVCIDYALTVLNPSVKMRKVQFA